MEQKKLKNTESNPSKIARMMSISIKHTVWLLAAGTVLLTASCGKRDKNSPGVEFMPDMYYSEAVKPYEESNLFSDSLGSRPPVPGTISQGSIPNSDMGIDALIYPYPNTPEGYEAAGAALKNPLTPDSASMAEAADLYTKFCVHCHGASGDGNGSIIATGKFPSPGTYWSKEGLTAGKMFHTMQFGKGMMGSHASQLSKTERWKLVSYVQDLINKHNGAGAPVAAAADTTKGKAAGSAKKPAGKI